jgi:hypothetical protein
VVAAVVGRENAEKKFITHPGIGRVGRKSVWDIKIANAVARMPLTFTDVANPIIRLSNTLKGIP